MTSPKQSIYRPSAPLSAPAGISRRRFIQQSYALLAVSAGLSPALAAGTLAAGNQLSASRCHLVGNTLGFNGERQDSATGLYPLGKGYRVYHPAMMRFHASDSMSPFGQGGINSYAYSLGDPINLRDPSGHCALFGLLVGAVIGAAISAAAEGIQAKVTHTSFDWKTVAIGSAIGLFSGCLGTAATFTTKTVVQLGMAVVDVVGSGAVDFGGNVAAGASNKQAGINAGIGAVIGLATFGAGAVIGVLRRNARSFRTRRASRISYEDCVRQDAPLEYTYRVVEGIRNNEPEENIDALLKKYKQISSPNDFDDLVSEAKSMGYEGEYAKSR